MILLTDTTHSLELNISTDCSVDYSTSSADITTTTFNPVSQQGNITLAGTTEIVSAPAVSTQRQVKFITIRNRSTSASVTVYVQKNVSGVLIRLTPDIVLAAGEVIEYLDGVGFRVLDPFAAVKILSELSNPPTRTDPYFTRDDVQREFFELILLELKCQSFLLARMQAQLIADTNAISLTELRQELDTNNIRSY